MRHLLIGLTIGLEWMPGDCSVCLPGVTGPAPLRPVVSCERMKAIVRALVWSVGLELLLLAPVLLGNYAHLGPLDFVFGVLAYLALFCHAPAVCLLGHWPSAQETLVVPALVHWLIWFMTFAVVFTLAGWFRHHRTAHEGRGS
jgi:hypothetical protein